MWFWAKRNRLFGPYYLNPEGGGGSKEGGKCASLAEAGKHQRVERIFVIDKILSKVHTRLREDCKTVNIISKEK